MVEILAEVKKEADEGRAVTLPPSTVRRLGDLDEVSMWCDANHIELTIEDDDSMVFVPYPRISVPLDTIRTLEFWLNHAKTTNGPDFVENARSRIANLLIEHGYETED